MSDSEAPAVDRVNIIRGRLEQALHPTLLEVHDDSAAHRGHVGAATGGGHFRVVIRSPAFDNQSLVARHRLVYGALGDLMIRDIHALAIEIPPP